MADKFPSDFYVTCATVIPVLFLALAVQGQTYNWLMGRYWERGRAFIRKIIRMGSVQESASDGQHAPGIISSTLAFVFFGSIATAIIVCGGGGETAALVALYRGAEFHDVRPVVLGSTLFHVAVVVGGPFIASLQPPSRAAPDSLPGQATPGEDQTAGDHTEPSPDTGSNGGQHGAS
jgi:hypothetical protein